MNLIETSAKRNIDVNIIEELKRRRMEQRMTGQQLEMKREEIIS
jgi:hypothetical protein